MEHIPLSVRCHIIHSGEQLCLGFADSNQCHRFWSSSVHISKDVQPESVPKPIVVRGNVVLYGGAQCVPFSLQIEKISGSRMEGREVWVRAGLQMEQLPPSSVYDIFVAPFFSLNGKI